MKAYFSLVLSFFIFFFPTRIVFTVFNLSYQAVDLNINNNAFPSELCELLDNSCVYGIGLCVVLARNGGYHI